MGTRECYAGANPAMDQHPNQEVSRYSRSFHTTETGISSSPADGPLGLYEDLLGAFNLSSPLNASHAN